MPLSMLYMGADDVYQLRNCFVTFFPTGQGCSPDAPRAARIFTDLAMKGHPYAQVNQRMGEVGGERGGGGGGGS